MLKNGYHILVMNLKYWYKFSDKHKQIINFHLDAS